MDPITAIGLLASLSSLIKASNSALQVMKTFKDGEKEYQELFNDLSIFEESLKGLDRVLRSRQTRHNISGEIINRALEEPFTTVQELEQRLGQISKCGTSTMRRIKWVQNKSSFKRLHERLKEQSTMLQSFLALAHAETFLAVCSQHPNFLQISAVADELDSDAVSLEGSDTTSLASRSLISFSSRTSIETAPSSIGSSTASLLRTSSDASSTLPLAPPVEENQTGQPTRSISLPTNALTIRRACRYNCYCNCHAPRTAVFGGRFLEPNALKPQCTELSCQGTISRVRSGEERPSTFFRKAFSQVMSSKSLKVRYDLNTYRMVSEGSDAMRYIKHGNLEKLKACLKTGEATLWDTAPDGWSLLHTAAYNRQLPIVEYLLELGANTEVADVGTRKPGDLALLKSLGSDATHVEQEIVEVFSKRDDYISDFDFTPIHIAVLNLYNPADPERPSLEQLIQVIDDANNAPAGTDWAKWKTKYRKRSPLYGEIVELFRASASQNPKTHKVIHNLLDQKDHKYCWTPLHWASSAGRIDKMKMLMNHGADPFILSNLDANIIHAAAESKTTTGMIGALDIWKRYPKQLNINQANRWAETPLHVAAWGSVGCTRLLLEAGADRNVQQEDLQVPLHCAGLSTRGAVRSEIVTLLCAEEGGLHINAQDMDGRPPIFEFVDDPECMEVLIDHGARLDLLDASGKSVFHQACIQDERESLKLLLRLSPNSVMVTVKDHDGNSPLVTALRHGSVDCAMTILELDDVGDIVGQDGWTPAHYAAKLGDVDVLEATLKHPSFVKGMKTIDGKTLEVVAMEACQWSGNVKNLIREHNCVT